MKKESSYRSAFDNFKYATTHWNKDNIIATYILQDWRARRRNIDYDKTKKLKCVAFKGNK